jgi:hypothetical protein
MKCCSAMGRAVSAPCTCAAMYLRSIRSPRATGCAHGAAQPQASSRASGGAHASPITRDLPRSLVRRSTRVSDLTWGTRDGSGQMTLRYSAVHVEAAAAMAMGQPGIHRNLLVGSEPALVIGIRKDITRSAHRSDQRKESA